MTIRAQLAHVGLYVRDLPRMEKFYTAVLGLVITDKGKSSRGDVDLTFLSATTATHHQMVLATGRPEEARFSTVNQVSFTVASLAELREVHRRALENDATGMRITTHGIAWSAYFADPEGNVIEAYVDTPFHVPQPHGAPFDLHAPDDEIVRATEEHCRANPGFQSHEEWAREQAARLV